MRTGVSEVATSSSSMPSLMLEMLRLLDVQEDQRVLEVGTGTGYNAALMCRLFGEENVTSIEHDPEVAKQAEENLAGPGLFPLLLVGDGLTGAPDRAPYNRLISTCTVSQVPYAWIQQVPEGRIVAPWGSSYFSGSFAVLSVRDGRACGRFSGRPAFMWARQQRGHRGYASDWTRDTATAAQTCTTSLNPLDLVRDLDTCFGVGIGIWGAWYKLCQAEDESDEATLWLLSDDKRSWAAAEYVPGQQEYEVDQYGPRHLWDEAAAALTRWRALGCPPRDRFGLTVDEGGQHIWLDSPDHIVG